MMKNLLGLLSLFGIMLLTTQCAKDEEKVIPKEEITPQEESTADKKAIVYPQPGLPYGLSWLGSNNKREKYTPGTSNQYFDPTKPILIFFHGQSTGKAKEGGYWLPYSKKGSLWVHENWLRKGWNVGVFNWEPWADELMTTNAEAKIYTRNGPKGFRYMLEGGYPSSYPMNPSGTGGVGEIAFDIIKEALKEHSTSTEVRFAGHSLGSQLATRVAFLVYQDIRRGKLSANTARVKRLALLDPAWTKSGKSWWNGDNDLNNDGSDDWVGERTRWSIFEMMRYWSDFAVEMYNTTELDQPLGIAMDNNSELRDRVCSSRMRAFYHIPGDYKGKHNAAFYQYLWSMNYTQPKECTVDFLLRRHLTGKKAPSASSSQSDILSRMNKNYYWEQVEGRYTPNPSDDIYEVKDK